jgi:ATP-dependent DNA helicase RecQ
LMEMATYFPQSRESLAMLHGVGKVKLDQYADTFVPIIQAYCQAQGIVEKRKTAIDPPLPSTPSLPKRTLEVLDLYRNCQTVPAIAGLFGVKQETVLAHLWKAAQAGESLPSDDRLLTYSQLLPAEQQRVFDTFATLGLARLRPIYEALGETVSYDELHLLRLHMASRPSEIN